MCFGGSDSSTPAPRRYEPYASPNVDPVGAKQSGSESSPPTGSNASSATSNVNTGLTINGN